LTIGVRGKLFIVSILLIASAVLASGAFLETQLRDLLRRQLEHQLLQQAKTTQVALSLAHAEELADVDTLTDQLGESADARVTIIALDGRVLGDSELTPEAIGALDNQGQLPEVLGALRDGVAVAQRYSATVRGELLYAAVAYPDGGAPRGIVRLAIPLSDIDQAVGRLRLLMLLAAAVGLAVAVFMSGLASELMTRTVRRLVDNARAITRGERSERIDASRRDELGRLAGSFNRMADELEQAVSSLTAERDRLQIILEHMHDAVLVLDADERLAIANRAAFKLLGLKERDIGRPLLDAVRLPALNEMVERARGGVSGSTEIELPPPRSRQLEVHAAPLPRMGGSLVVLHDVTEVRRLERVRRDFVANVSHELRTPVSVIRANAETLLAGALDDRERGPGFVQAIHRNAERLSRLIADLLDLSRVEAGAVELTLQPVMAKVAVEATVESFNPRARARDIEIQTAVDELLAVRADVNALGQILGNILDNALKYTPDKGRVILRAVLDEESEDTVRLEVEDSGPGIEPHHRKRVFERFYRVDPGRSRELGGTGLGLSIVRHLAESMGGRVGVDAAPKRGSIFWVELAREVPPQSSRRPPA
jgi:two-component system phosphate regulon sensor histidine kinase PhoR